MCKGVTVKVSLLGTEKLKHHLIFRFIPVLFWESTGYFRDDVVNTAISVVKNARKLKDKF
ncbi:6352_t:CDS:2 [Ambispora leptoticha]|uniref:6352_t:CDS:1 n=1 Tax=Ambispora leptoticha TaxID=144679 RepID=A0A9N9G420_9GLOM|nr:6352_t:CDS:2 [Ambispora leptoticha]